MLVQGLLVLTAVIAGGGWPECNGSPPCAVNEWPMSRDGEDICCPLVFGDEPPITFRSGPSGDGASELLVYTEKESWCSDYADSIRTTLNGCGVDWMASRSPEAEKDWLFVKVSSGGDGKLVVRSKRASTRFTECVERIQKLVARRGSLPECVLALKLPLASPAWKKPKELRFDCR